MSGKELRELLASKGILQKDIARQLNMTPGGFSQQLRAIKTSRQDYWNPYVKHSMSKWISSMEAPNILKDMSSSSNLI